MGCRNKRGSERPDTEHAYIMFLHYLDISMVDKLNSTLDICREELLTVSLFHENQHRSYAVSNHW
jgi:hypothetical protein